MLGFLVWAMAGVVAGPLSTKPKTAISAAIVKFSLLGCCTALLPLIQILFVIPFLLAGRVRHRLGTASRYHFPNSGGNIKARAKRKFHSGPNESR